MERSIRNALQAQLYLFTEMFGMEVGPIILNRRAAPSILHSLVLMRHLSVRSQVL